MRVIETPIELRRALADCRERDRIAFVPTMGALHAGHIGLMKKARRMADVVVASIYVNPLQFGPNEDLASYPRPFAEDAAMCEAAGVDFLFHPHNLYPEGGPLVTLKVAGLDQMLCGAHRPGHFDGVATVVSILFNIVQPHLAIFGEKDFQQLSIIQRMVHDLQMPVEVIGAPTRREADGLAMSSRNRYLSPEERTQAAAIPAALRAMQAAFSAGNHRIPELIELGRQRLAAAGLTPEYLEIRDAATLSLDVHPTTHTCRIFVAVRLGRARLIDNMPLAIVAEEHE